MFTGTGRPAGGAGGARNLGDVPTVPIDRRAVRASLAGHRALAAAGQAVLDDVAATRARIVALAAADREARTRAELAGITIDRLGELTDRNLRLRALHAAGYATAADLHAASPAALDAVPGVGPATVKAVVAAVGSLAEAIGATKHLRIDLDDLGGEVRHTGHRAARPGPDRTDPAVAEGVLAAAHHLLTVEPELAPHRTLVSDYAASVAELAPVAAPAAGWGFGLRRRRTREAATRALAILAGWDPVIAGAGLPGVVGRMGALVARPAPTAVDLRRDYAARAAAYWAVLETLVPRGDDALAAHGLLAADLAERVAAHPLDRSLLRAELRGYQAFGARFLLNQGRALLGDEMGLGKTVQALAAVADRVAAGERHALVVCPAAVLENWLREVAAHTRLEAHRLHGPGREEATAAWLARGGVAVTTYDGLEHLPADGVAAPGPGGVGPAVSPFLVVDEAHYVKNPGARRSERVAAWARRAPRVAYLTGTPLENRLEEFLALVEHLQPELVDRLPRHAGVAGAAVFRRAMAPVYLRRNLDDVLVELPGLIAVDEWLPVPQGEPYRAAVAAGNLMAMRRATFLTGEPVPAKAERLAEIAEDAAANAHKTLVFSYFLDVLDAAAGSLRAAGLEVHGPLTGAVPPAGRQELIDAFTDAAPGAVLVAQVQAGGTGVNLQAASVVVLCEPQLTPTREAQAVARAHRMGQVRTVVVHRLLAQGAVDERIVERLAVKDRVFEEYVRDSAVAAAPAAVDVTEGRLARQVVADEQARLGYGPVWEELMTDFGGNSPRHV